MLLEHVVHIRMPLVEDGISHGGRRVAHHPEGFQMSVVRIMGVGDEHMHHIMQVTVQLAIR